MYGIKYLGDVMQLCIGSKMHMIVAMVEIYLLVWIWSMLGSYCSYESYDTKK